MINVEAERRNELAGPRLLQRTIGFAEVIGPAEIDDMLADYAAHAPCEATGAELTRWPPVVEQARPPAARSRYVTAGTRFWSECFGWTTAPGDSVLG